MPPASYPFLARLPLTGPPGALGRERGSPPRPMEARDDQQGQPNRPGCGFKRHDQGMVDRSPPTGSQPLRPRPAAAGGGVPGEEKASVA